MEILFLGSGGGRINLIKQLRWTGGFKIKGSLNIHVDPGPGALIRLHQVKENPLKTDAIIITHAHLDHFSDASVMIEAMSHYTLKRKGILVGSRNLLEVERAISQYHLSKVKEQWSAEWNVVKEFRTEKGTFRIKPIKSKHEEPTAFGFVLEMDGKRVGYSSDTEYYEGLGREYKESDILILNLIKPYKDRYGGHLFIDDAVLFLKEASPNLAVITHFGLKMLSYGPEKAAEYLSEKTRCKVIAAKDGMKIKI